MILRSVLGPSGSSGTINDLNLRCKSFTFNDNGESTDYSKIEVGQFPFDSPAYAARCQKSGGVQRQNDQPERSTSSR